MGIVDQSVLDAFYLCCCIQQLLVVELSLCRPHSLRQQEGFGCPVKAATGADDAAPEHIPLLLQIPAGPLSPEFHIGNGVLLRDIQEGLRSTGAIQNLIPPDHTGGNGAAGMVVAAHSHFGPPGNAGGLCRGLTDGPDHRTAVIDGREPVLRDLRPIQDLP